MNIRISLSDGVPIYQQIVTQVRYLVAAGQLEPGVELPPELTASSNAKVSWKNAAQKGPLSPNR